MKDSLRCAKAAIVLFLLCASSASAQIGVQATGAHITHELMGNATGGYVHLPIGRTRFRLGYEFVRGSARDLRSTCAGLAPPDRDCSPQPGINQYALHSILAEYVQPVMRWGQFNVDALFSGRFGAVASKFRPDGSNVRLAATENTLGGHAGLAASWLPWKGGRTGFELSGSIGGLHSIIQQGCCDLYEPFNDGIAFTRLSLGFVVHREGRSR